MLTVCYFLAYLQNGSRAVILGLLSAVVFNWLVLWNLERGQSRWSIFQWLLAVLTLLLALSLGYSSLFLLLDVIEYGYYPGAGIILIASGVITMLSLIFHLFFSFIESLVKKDE
jgi:hypothetical protein